MAECSVDGCINEVEKEGDTFCVDCEDTGLGSNPNHGPLVELIKGNAALTEENQILRNVIAGMLVKAKVIPEESLQVPWGVEALLRLAGMWTADELAWVQGGPNYKAIVNALHALEQRVGRLEEGHATFVSGLDETTKNLRELREALVEFNEMGETTGEVKIVPLAHEKEGS